MTKDKKNTYLRLLGYVKPYWWKMTIGVVAGFIAGSSLFGSFFWIKDLVEPFEKKIEVKVGAQIKSEVGESLQLKETDSQLNVKGLKELATLEKYAKILGIEVEDKDGGMTWQFFLLSISGLIFLVFMKNIGTYLNRYYTRWVGARVIADLREEVFNRLTDQSLKFYGNMDVGQLISRCTNDTSQIEHSVAQVIADVTRAPIELIACFGFLVYISVVNDTFFLPLILMFGLPLSVLPIILIGKKIRKTYRRAFAKIADIFTRMHEVFTGILLVKAYNMEREEKERFKQVNENYFTMLVKALRLELAMSPLMEFVTVLCTIVFLVFCYAWELRLSEIVILLAPVIMGYRPLKDLARINTYLQRSIAAAERYFELIDMRMELQEKTDAIELNSFEKEIRFENVNFSYGDRKILENFNLVIPRGKIVAVVGETGSGKTTIANLLARFYDVDSGRILIDGIDLRDVKISSLRKLIGIVSQTPILFNDTVAANIAYGVKDASMEEIIEAAKKANAYDFIVDGRHPEGFNTVVGEKGFKLSGGEKQRISIARAILKNPPILILDEATSALDTVTERLVQDALEKLMEHRTVFAIAHRLSTVQHADMIIVLSGGKIIESGSHSELLARGGQYKKLFEMQFKRSE